MAPDFLDPADLTNKQVKFLKDNREIWKERFNKNSDYQFEKSMQESLNSLANQPKTEEFGTRSYGTIVNINGSDRSFITDTDDIYEDTSGASTANADADAWNEEADVLTSSTGGYGKAWAYTAAMKT